MAKYNISPQEALAQVKQCRPLVEPNDGFMQQLEMYHQMQTPINAEDSPIYQRWMYQREVQLSSECGMAPDAGKIRFEDEHITPDDEGKFADAEFKCKKCRLVHHYFLNMFRKYSWQVLTSYQQKNPSTIPISNPPPPTPP